MTDAAEIPSNPNFKIMKNTTTAVGNNNMLDKFGGGATNKSMSATTANQRQNLMNSASMSSQQVNACVLHKFL